MVNKGRETLSLSLFCQEGGLGWSDCVPKIHACMCMCTCAFERETKKAAQRELIHLDFTNSSLHNNLGDLVNLNNLEIKLFQFSCSLGALLQCYKQKPHQIHTKLCINMNQNQQQNQDFVGKN